MRGFYVFCNVIVIVLVWLTFMVNHFYITYSNHTSTTINVTLLPLINCSLYREQFDGKIMICAGDRVIQKRLQNIILLTLYMGFFIYMNGTAVNCFTWSAHMRLKFVTKITPQGWIFWTMIFYHLKKFTSRSI